MTGQNRISTSRRLSVQKVALAIALLAAGSLALSRGQRWSHATSCYLRLRNGMILEIPEPGLTLEDFKELIHRESHGCAFVTTRSGTDSPDALVTSPGGDKASITLGDRRVYVSTDSRDS